jgi:hypothetical protein
MATEKTYEQNLAQHIAQFKQYLEDAERSNQLASFLTRRLSAIGTVYALVFGAFLLLSFAWRGDEGKSGAASGLFSHFDKSTFEQLMSWPVQLVVALALLLPCLGKVYTRSRVIATLMLLPIVLLPLLAKGDLQTVILIHFMHAVLLLGGGLMFDRTFGFTRALARSRFYLARLGVVSLKPESKEKTEELNKLFDAFLADRYRDHLGDTFFTLDAIKAKVGAA